MVAYDSLCSLRPKPLVPMVPRGSAPTAAHREPATKSIQQALAAYLSNVLFDLYVPVIPIFYVSTKSHAVLQL